jgi:predicted membrane channel-forming protein YqfA (hemolysin III family)
MVMIHGGTKMKLKKSKRQLEWAISFWIGIGLMSIIDVIKIVYNQHALSYNWIMFGISIIFIIICVIYLIAIRKKK